MDRINQRTKLLDGRMLGFAEYGRSDGAPVVYFHGWPSSRLEPFAMHQVCADLGIRLIAPDRPGLGLSDFQPGRTIVSFTADINQLADYVGLKRFAVLGVSGGGPYAAASAACLPERLSVALLICSMGPADTPEAVKGMVPINRWLLSTARHFPKLAQAIAGLCLWAIWGKGNQPLPKQIERRLPPADQQALNSPEIRQALVNSSVEALRHGVRAVAADGLLYGRPWGFLLKEIRTQVFLWHGEKDVIVPPTMGHYLAENIPNCSAKFYPEDGHFSLPFGRIREILKVVEV